MPNKPHNDMFPFTNFLPRLTLPSQSFFYTYPPISLPLTFHPCTSGSCYSLSFVLHLNFLSVLSSSTFFRLQSRFSIRRGRTPLSFLASVLDAQIGGFAIREWKNPPKIIKNIGFPCPTVGHFTSMARKFHFH